MEYKTRIKRSHGVNEVRLTIRVTDEELAGVERICDDKYCTLDTVKSFDHEVSLAYARTLCFWVSMWNEGDKKKLVAFAQKRKAAEVNWASRSKRNASRSGKVKRVRTNRK